MGTRRPLLLEALAIHKMASGNLSLSLTEHVDWDSFADYAAKFVAVVGGRITAKTPGVDTQMVDLSIEGADFWLAMDELGISLDSKDSKGNDVIPRLYARLQNL